MGNSKWFLLYHLSESEKGGNQGGKKKSVSSSITGGRAYLIDMRIRYSVWKLFSDFFHRYEYTSKNTLFTGCSVV